MPTPGISFSLFDNDHGQNRDSRPGGGVSPQEAIRVLSLHVPKVVGAYSPIPSMLLNAPGSAALGGGGGTMSMPGGDIEEILRRLFGQASGPMGGGMMPPMGGSPAGGPPTGGGAPPPSVTPGGGDQRKLPDPGEGTYQPPPNPIMAPTGPTAPPMDRVPPRDRRV